VIDGPGFAAAASCRVAGRLLPLVILVSATNLRVDVAAFAPVTERPQSMLVAIRTKVARGNEILCRWEVPFLIIFVFQSLLVSGDIIKIHYSVVVWYFGCQPEQISFELARTLDRRS
jgi:hypothetical protein